jgi:hypothetical protein
MVALLVADLFWNSNQFDHTFDRSRVFPKTEITELLRSRPPGRVLVVPSGLETNRSSSAGAGAEKIIAPPNTLLPYQISTVSGKNQQFPGWYREFASLVEGQPNLSHVVFDQYRSPFLDVLNVRYVLTHESAPPLAGYDLLQTPKACHQYENKSAIPRSFFADRVIEVKTHADALRNLSLASFDPRTTSAVEGVSPATMETSGIRQADALAEPVATTTATIIEDKRDRVEIQTDNGTAGTLVLSDNYYPGWRASVDGAPVEVFRANATMRAVNVPAGRHLVSFRFIPAAFFVSMYVSLAAAAVTLAALIFSILTRRRAAATISDKIKRQLSTR